MLRRWKSALFAGALLSAPASLTLAGECQWGLYTSVADGDCTPVAELEAGRKIVSGQGDNVFECPAPAGARLFFVDSDSGSWYVVEVAGKRQSFERQTIYDNPPGNFPRVGLGGKVEWLAANGAIIGFIFRVGFTGAESGKNFSLLRSVRFGPDAPQFLGSATSNEAARALFGDCGK